MHAFGHDLLFAARLLKKSPAFALAAVATLALGIGANATMYSLADAVLLRPLAVRDAERIVHVYQRRPQAGVFPLAYADYFYFREHARSFDAIAAHYPTAPMHVAVDGEPGAATGAVASASYFEVLQLQPALGRFFAASEDTARNRDAVAVISYGFWQRRFGGATRVLGSTMDVNGRPFTIVGIAPRGFRGVVGRGLDTDVWIPTAMFDVGYRYCDGFNRACTIVQLLGRVKRGVAPDEAQRELDVLAAQLAAAYPATNADRGVTVIPARGLGQGPQGSETQQVQLFVAVVSLVLLIACANIAGLLLARSTARRREIAVRLALGARRGRIVRQLLAESVLLAVAGGGSGLLLAVWGTNLLASLYAHDSAGRPIAFDLGLRGAVIAATAGLTLLTALVAGLAPALQASRGDLVGVLKDEGASGGARRARLRIALVTLQVAVSVVLLVGAALLVLSAERVTRGPGFDPAPLVTLRLRPSLVDYPRERAHAFQRDVMQRLESLPGVTSASLSVYMAMFSAGTRVRVSAPGATAEPTDAIGSPVGPRYFETLRQPIVAGREFTAQDRSGAPPVAIVNDVLAERLWAGSSAVGQVLVADGQPHTVVGVVRDAQYYVSGEAPRPQLFLSYWQPHGSDAFLNDARAFVRVTGDPANMMAAIRRAIADVDPAVPLVEDHPFRDRVSYMFQPVRMARGLLLAFALLAVALSAVGLYGVLAFTVAQRTREIGVRLALGAGRGQIASLVLRDGLLLTTIGTIVGLAAAWSADRFVASLLFGLDAHNLTAFIAAPSVIAVVALAASYLPARRAASVSPLTAIRYE